MPTPTNLPERLSVSPSGCLNDEHDKWIATARFEVSSDILRAIAHRYNAHPSLLHEVEELRKDKKRLDWLESVRWFAETPGGLIIKPPHFTTRQAIDSAMNPTK